MLAGNAPYGEVNPVVVVVGGSAGRRPAHHQRQRQHRRRVRLGGEAGFADQVGQGPQGQEVRLHEPALDQPGARQPDPAERRPQARTDVELVKTGGFGEGVAALDKGLVDVVPVPEPLWSKFKDKYRAVVVASEALPPLGNVVGVTTVEGAAKNGKFISAVIRARRKAVQFMKTNPDEAGDIIAKAYNIERDVAAQRGAQPDEEHDRRRAVLERRRRSICRASSG